MAYCSSFPAWSTPFAAQSTCSGGWPSATRRCRSNFVPAITGRWRTLYYELDFEPNVDTKRVLKELDELSFLAVNIDSDNPAAWRVRAESLIRERRWDAALEANAKQRTFLRSIMASWPKGPTSWSSP